MTTDKEGRVSLVGTAAMMTLDADILAAALLDQGRGTCAWLRPLATSMLDDAIRLLPAAEWTQGWWSCPQWDDAGDADLRVLAVLSKSGAVKYSLYWTRKGGYLMRGGHWPHWLAQDLTRCQPCIDEAKRQRLVL